jgi:hypothetical protein
MNLCTTKILNKTWKKVEISGVGGIICDEHGRRLLGC